MKPSRRNLSWTLVFLATALLLPAAAMSDARVAAAVHAHNIGPAIHASRIAWVIKWPGVFYFTLSLAALIVLLDYQKWRQAVLLLASGVLSGFFYSLLKWFVGRSRPFPRFAPAVPPFELHPFHGGIQGLWNSDNQAFPSGHACLAFATATALAMIFPRGRWFFFLGAAAVGAERVLEGAHYPSDVVAGAIFGIIAALLARMLLAPLLPPGNSIRGFEVVPLKDPHRSAAGG